MSVPSVRPLTIHLCRRSEGSSSCEVYYSPSYDTWADIVGYYGNNEEYLNHTLDSKNGISWHYGFQCNNPDFSDKKIHLKKYAI